METANEQWKGVIGSEGVGVTNENGERFLEFCAINDLVIGGTLFKHKDIHKFTWESPNHRDRNQIDHIAINGRCRGSLLDTRAMRGADVGSDHHLVIAKLRLKLTRYRVAGAERRSTYDTVRLKSPTVRKAFVLELKNRFQCLQADDEGVAGDMSHDTETDDEDLVENEWNKFKVAYNSTATKLVGFKKRKYKEWISETTWRAINERRKLKLELNSVRSERIKALKRSAYREKDKEVKRSVRADKRRWMKNKATDAENAAKLNQMGTLYKITKQLCNDKATPPSGVRSKDGNLLTQEDLVRERWKEHFQEVLNRPAPTHQIIPEDCVLAEDEDCLDIDTGPFTLEEVQAAIKHLKNGKTPGIDGIDAEMLQVEPVLAAGYLCTLFNHIRENMTVPDDWKKAIIVKVPKKGDLSKCDNFRGISLLSVPSKVLGRVVIERIKEGIDTKLRCEQAGFRKGRGTTEQVFILRNIIEQSIEWQAPLYINFVDFAKAFDSLDRSRLWKILRHYGIPSELVYLIKAMYADSCYSVIDNGKMSNWFDVKTGVRQGCVMSGFLFIMAVDWVMTNTVRNRRRGLRWRFTSMLEELDYADDIALLASTCAHMQEKSSRLQTIGSFIGLEVNTQKTKIMRLNSKTQHSISINGTSLEDVDKFVYLGSEVGGYSGAESDISRRLCLARGAFVKLKPVWNSTAYQYKTKLKIFRSNVLAVLLYGAETWKMTEHDACRLDRFQRGCLRRIFRIFWPEKITNKDLYKKAEMIPVSDMIADRRWRWLGHVLRLESINHAKVSLTWSPEGRRRRGRPKTTWRRTVESEWRRLGFNSWTQIEQVAKDRAKWKELTYGLTHPP